MKNLKHILFCLSLITLSCNNSSKRNKETDVVNHKKQETIKLSSTVAPAKNPNDSLQNFARKELELLELRFKQDTLEIVATTKFLYYPFGKYKTFNGLKQALPMFSDSIEVDTSNNKLHRMTFKKSFLKFFYDDEKRTFEIVSGTIHDREIALLNNIKVGMTMIDFMNIFFHGISIEQLKGIKIIKMVSGLEGIFDYFYFDNNILTSIKLDTDYLFDKK